MSKLLQFEGPSFKLSDLVRFMNKAPGNRDVLADYVKNAGEPDQINMKRMEDASNINLLRQHLSSTPESLSRLRELQRAGLSAARLVDYLSENTTTRTAMIEYMLQRNDGVKRFNDQMKLSLFPDAVAFHLIEDANASGVPIPSIVDRLKDWQTGKQFSQLLQQHVLENKPITPEALDYLSEKAGGIAVKASPDGSAVEGGDSDARQRRKASDFFTARGFFFAPKADYEKPEALAGALQRQRTKSLPECLKEKRLFCWVEMLDSGAAPSRARARRSILPLVSRSDGR